MSNAEEQAIKNIYDKFPQYVNIDFQFEENGEVSYQGKSLDGESVKIEEVQKEVNTFLNRKQYIARFVFYIDDIHASNKDDAKEIALKINDYNMAEYQYVFESM